MVIRVKIITDTDVLRRETLNFRLIMRHQSSMTIKLSLITIT